jgi:hypothetical protein
MPIQELIFGMNGSVPLDVREVAAGLQYRDFITVGLLLKRLVVQKSVNGSNGTLPDTWIYIQEKDVKVGRLQIFNNWSPFMVSNPEHVWIGMEYFCNVIDPFWKLSDEEIKHLAINELVQMGLASQEDVLDGTVLRMEKTYPAYFGSYSRFDVVKNYLNRFHNLFLVGRNGMHKYNNSDHSMLTSMVAVDNIVRGDLDKSNIWEINTEQEYHEEKVIAASESRINVFRKVKNQLKQEPSYAASFQEYVFSGFNLFHLILTAILILTQITIFKISYPQAEFINGDSYVYIGMASRNSDINVYPIGYPRFLRLVSVFTHSDTALVVLQYLMLNISVLFLLFTIFYFYKIPRISQLLLIGVLLINPLFLYLSNYILSDALFIPLSFMWFATLFWILNKPSARVLFWHSIILVVLFMVRYSALYYPIISFGVILISKSTLREKVLSVLFSILLVGSFISFTTTKIKADTGISTFAPFSGWQMVNNAMYAYRVIDSSHLKPVPKAYQALDREVRLYFDSAKAYPNNYPQEELQASTVYMWSKFSPLDKYMHKVFKNDTVSSEFKEWASMGPLYNSYGRWIIKEYPIAYARYFLFPNLIKYFTPELEFLDKYNMGISIVNQDAVQWFKYKSNKIRYNHKSYRINQLKFYPEIFGTLNFLYVSVFWVYFLLFGFHAKDTYKSLILLSIMFWIFNIGFSVFASPVSLRFQIFPICINIINIIVLLPAIMEAAFSKKYYLSPKVAL